MTCSWRLSFTGAMALLCGCASTPVQYYTLTRPMARSGDTGLAACCKVTVARVVIPPQVDRSELVIRQGDYQANVLGNQLWLSPLRDEIRYALSAEINAKLSTLTKASGRVEATYTVSVNVTRFEVVPGEYALISADTLIKDLGRPNTTSRNCSTTARVAIQRDMPAVVGGLQSATAEIADTIAGLLATQ